MLTLKLFESQINVIKRCYFNPKRKKKKKAQPPPPRTKSTKQNKYINKQKASKT